MTVWVCKVCGTWREQELDACRHVIDAHTSAIVERVRWGLGPNVTLTAGVIRSAAHQLVMEKARE